MPTPTAQLRALVSTHAPAHANLFSSLRRTFKKLLPTAHEIVYEYRDCIVTTFSPTPQGYQGVFSLRASAEGIRLYFGQGKLLPDPAKLLQGSASQVRYLPIHRAADLKQPEVQSLLAAALSHNRVAFAASGKPLLTIRSTTASKASKKTKRQTAGKPPSKGLAAKKRNKKKKSR
jgi:hypothetical protein